MPTRSLRHRDGPHGNADSGAIDREDEAGPGCRRTSTSKPFRGRFPGASAEAAADVAYTGFQGERADLYGAPGLRSSGPGRRSTPRSLSAVATSWSASGTVGLAILSIRRHRLTAGTEAHGRELPIRMRARTFVLLGGPGLNGSVQRDGPKVISA